ncbi:MAG: TGS domain-containing protein, partial [Candidatus Ratteibacteria bacterium]|nr:TGS domain-containing protein [Candidatus Ratteibacteria bacterium]
ERIFNLLNIIRVYTKSPGKVPDTDNPYTLKSGSLVIDLAELIHKDIAKNFKYARLWRDGEDKIAIAGRDYPLKDGDIVELHI